MTNFYIIYVTYNLKEYNTIWILCGFLIKGFIFNIQCMTSKLSEPALKINIPKNQNVVFPYDSL
jgi:hypothetical protein